MVVTCQNSLGQTGPKISHYPISRPRCWEVFLHQLVARQIMKSSIERWSSSNFHFSFLIPQWGIRIKGECFKEKLFNSSGPSGKQQSVGRWIEVGQVWSGGVMDPSLYHSVTQNCSYLRRKLEPTAIMRGGGVIHPGSYHCVPGPPPPQSLLPPPLPLYRGSLGEVTNNNTVPN